MSLRVFVDPAAEPFAPGAQVSLSKEEVHYLLRVRRANVGQEFELLDGLAERYRGRLVRVDGGAKDALVEILERLALPSAAPRRIVLVGEIDKNTALEALTDATVMGAHDFAWVDCARSQGRAPSEARVERAVRAAQRQSGRPDRPRLHRFGSLAEALEADFPGQLLWASLADEPAPTHAHLNAAIRLAIGPEGGFTDEEVQLLRDHQALPLRIAPWTLVHPRAIAVPRV
jgi:16S rRNA (uracil1498-N3)-methyltransferase